MTRLPPLVELRGVSFGYGGRAILRGVDLAIRPGQLVGVLGVNGAGKTTLFRGLAGLSRPLSGAMLCRAVRIGYAAQRETLDPIFPLRVEDVVRMGGYGHLTRSGRIAPEDRELARQCLERLGLAGRERTAFAALSGGQRRRALLARALMARPELLLLDEPTSGVDRRSALAIRNLARELAAGGAAVLWSTHDLAPIRGIAAGALHVAGGTVRALPPHALDDARTTLGAESGAGAAEEAGGRR